MELLPLKKELFIILVYTPYGWIKGVAVIDLEQGSNLSRTIMVDRSHTSCELYLRHWVSLYDVQWKGYGSKEN